MNDLKRQNKTILEKLNMVLSKSTIATPKKLDVPAHIKSAVHDGYKCGMEERNLKWIQKDNDGKCLKYNSTPNKETTDQVVAFTKGMYPATENGVINVAVERYFESVRQRELKAAAGKAEAHRQKMMLYGRRKRKMTWRKTALKAKRSYDEDKKKKVQAAMVIDLMSSEEENDSEDDSFVIKKLPWRSEELNRIVQELDDKWVSLQTPKSRKQMAKRRRMDSVVSSRAPPSRLSKQIEWTVNQ
ncbi:uncharacterized protein LOC110461067 [Mizuhopecten yessoensis]|uniref:Uncharacterized protein n=1 Tax=Mizuhopecten yessoensis TaxID=6573 RepID=A0A210Q124_MIZYE|nr:uncharacterized protein LOC110461067 [Mizuhopecten yessoensis]OWF42438.1 hypothetical protein KP79_PYT23281 [Mizuhopecten yessoensis]